MVVVEADGALVFLDVLEGSLRSGWPLSDGEVDRVLSMGFMSFMLDAYSSLVGLTRVDVAKTPFGPTSWAKDLTRRP